MGKPSIKRTVLLCGAVCLLIIFGLCLGIGVIDLPESMMLVTPIDPNVSVSEPSLEQMTTPVPAVIVPKELSFTAGLDVEKVLDVVIESADASTVELEYHSSDETVAVVDDAGTVTPVGAGSCVIEITAIGADGFKAIAETTVFVKKSVCEHCNQSGHSAGECPDKVVSLPESELCENCGKSGHIASDCPDKKADAQQLVICSYCNAQGHTIDVCSKKTIDEAPCNYCKKVGHTIKKCPVKAEDETPCGYCGVKGHKVDSCAKKAVDEAPCTYCQQTGHKVDVCPKKVADEAPCAYCKQTGHKIDACSKKIADEAKPKGCAYCGVAGHSAKKCVKKAVDKGAVGRWSIPDVGVNVAVYADSAAAITDAEDSANYFTFGTQKLIADHNYQGFEAIKKCKVGMSAYLDTGNGKEKYICIKVMKGHNRKNDLTDANGSSLRNSNPGGITCYTCNENSSNVTIVMFAPEIPVKEFVVTEDNRELVGYTGMKDEKLVIPDSFIGSDGVRYLVTEIQNKAFADCKNLKSVTIGSEITYVGERAFEGCTNLSAINVDKNNRSYCSSDGVLYNKKKTTLFCYPAGRNASSFTVEAPTEHIGYRAFSGCVMLKTVVFESSVRSIGQEAFTDCKSLTRIEFGEGVNALGHGGFYDCDGLVNIKIPGNVSSVGAWAFADCNDLTNVVIEDGVVRVGDSAFQGCTSLSTISIPKSVTYIGWGAFKDCSRLAQVIYNGTKAQWESISVSGDNMSLFYAILEYIF